MASMRDIKRRIASVKNTQQITKAMNLVSASKLQKSKTRMESTRSFRNEIKTSVADIVNSEDEFTHLYFETRELKKVLVVVICGDLGLCGGYNTNACIKAMQLMNSIEQPLSFITVGSKSRDYFTRRELDVVDSFTHISEKPYYDGAAKIGKKVFELYDSGEYDEVYIVYTHFETTISHKPMTTRLLPVDTNMFEKRERDIMTIEPLMSYEPSLEATLNAIIPQYINMVIYGALLESATCEQGARMTAMDAATKNAGEMIDKLTISYNRARQSAITQEISEIVGGANALDLS